MKRLDEFYITPDNVEFLNEGSLSKIWRYIQDHDTAMMSAFRDESPEGEPYSKKENLERNAELMKSLRKDYTVISLKGVYIENYGQDNAKEVNENSFFIVNNKNNGKFIKDIIGYGKKYDQDSVIIIPKGGEGAYLYGTNKTADYPGWEKKAVQGRFRPKKENEFMSKKGGARFAFTDD